MVEYLTKYFDQNGYSDLDGEEQIVMEKLSWSLDNLRGRIKEDITVVRRLSPGQEVPDAEIDLLIKTTFAKVRSIVAKKFN